MLWFAWKFVPLWYQQQLEAKEVLVMSCCDLLENSYLCGISNNRGGKYLSYHAVVICLKIRTFVVSATTFRRYTSSWQVLWFAWKFVPLWYQQQPVEERLNVFASCDLLENSYLCGISNNTLSCFTGLCELWFAWKFVPLWYQQQPNRVDFRFCMCCDLLENSYLCGISNNS